MSNIDACFELFLYNYCYYKKMIKNGKKKRCFLFSYVYITSIMYRKYIGSFSLPNYNLIR